MAEKLAQLEKKGGSGDIPEYIQIYTGAGGTTSAYACLQFSNDDFWTQFGKIQFSSGSGTMRYKTNTMSSMQTMTKGTKYDISGTWTTLYIESVRSGSNLSNYLRFYKK